MIKDFILFTGGNGLRGFTGSYNHDGDYILIGRQGALCGNVRKVTGKTYVTEHAIAVCASKEHETTFFTTSFPKDEIGTVFRPICTTRISCKQIVTAKYKRTIKNRTGKNCQNLIPYR